MHLPQISALSASKEPHVALEDLFQQKSLDSQVQDLKQIVAVQQQMLNFQADMQAAIAAQNEELQKISVQTLQTANKHIQKLEDQLGVQNQELILNNENAQLKQEIDHLQITHQAAWTAFLKKIKTTVEDISIKIKHYIHAFELFKQQKKEAAELAKEVDTYKKVIDKNDPAYVNFVQRWHKYCKNKAGPLSHIINELFNFKTQYDTAIYSIDALEACLKQISAINIDAASKHPVYVNLSTGKNLELIDKSDVLQKVVKVLDRDTITKLKISNAALKVMKNEMQKSHLFSIKNFPSFLYSEHIKPCTDYIQMCTQKISQLNQNDMAARSLQETEVDKCISSNIKKREVINMQLEKLYSEIETMVLSNS